MLTESRLKILLIEDDQRLAALTRKYLEGHGVATTVRTDGIQGLREALSSYFDAILLDIMLPGMNGLEVCRKIREHQDVPVIMITARDEEADRVLGLEIGADDYVCKPFSPRELLARIHALVRRAQGRIGPGKKTLKIGDLTLDPTAAVAQLNNIPIPLTAYEFELLYALASNAGRIMRRERLMEIVGQDADPAFDRSIDVHISRIRKKLGDDPSHPSRIKTVRGMGYLYLPDTR